jgi:hypothetical protein
MGGKDLFDRDLSGFPTACKHSSRRGSRREIRISKSEIRNNGKPESSKESLLGDATFSDFSVRIFGFVSNFELRISNFPRPTFLPLAFSGANAPGIYPPIRRVSQ